MKMAALALVAALLGLQVLPKWSDKSAAWRPTPAGVAIRSMAAQDEHA